jgi:hypothetical protein
MPENENFDSQSRIQDPIKKDSDISPESSGMEMCIPSGCSSL